MPSCVYDNPEAMAREYYVDGRLMEAYTAELLESKELSMMGIVDDVFGAGDWNPGQLAGDVRALDDSLRACIQDLKETT